MPLTSVGISSALSISLPATGILGTSVPLFTNGVAAGVMLWVEQLTVTTVDVGTAGAGTGLLPCTIPLALLLPAMLTGFAGVGLLGIMAPSLATGLANGFAEAFPQGLITTVNPTVGVGVATASFPGPTSVPSMIEGLSSVGMSGSYVGRLATAIGIGLDTAFAGFVISVPIVGSPSNIPSSGIGTGKIF